MTNIIALIGEVGDESSRITSRYGIHRIVGILVAPQVVIQVGPCPGLPARITQIYEPSSAIITIVEARSIGKRHTLTTAIRIVGIRDCLRGQSRVGCSVGNLFISVVEGIRMAACAIGHAIKASVRIVVPVDIDRGRSWVLDVGQLAFSVRVDQIRRNTSSVYTLCGVAILVVAWKTYTVRATDIGPSGSRVAWIGHTV